MRYGSLSPFLRPQVLFTTNEPQSYVFGGRNHPLHSNSQKKILLNYAKENGYLNTQFFVDDGYSGTSFERPSFKKMIEGIKSGEIKRVIIKDMSRFGRDYLQVGMYTEIMFAEYDIHFIAVNDGVDSQKGENDLTPFRNLFKNTRHLGGVNC